MSTIAFQPKVRAASITPPPSTSDIASTLGFSITKGGSTLLFHLLEAAASRAGVTYFAVEDVLFAQGTVGPDRPERLAMRFEENGYCYGGWRGYPHYRIPLIGRAPAVWLVRDPRDMIVSLYYSVAYSHPEPGGDARRRFLATRDRVRSLGLDAFSRQQAMRHARTIEGYYAQSFLSRPNVRIYRYEDVIFEKRAWLTDMCEWFGWALTPADVDEIVTPHDIVPETEDPYSHIRRVTPGGFREALSPTAIRRIENALGPFMTDFGYESEPGIT